MSEIKFDFDFWLLIVIMSLMVIQWNKEKKIIYLQLIAHPSTN